LTSASPTPNGNATYYSKHFADGFTPVVLFVRLSFPAALGSLVSAAQP